MMATGETCDTALPIAGNGVFNGDTTGMTADYSFRDQANCQGNSSTPPAAPDQIFQVTIPANNRLTAELNTSDGGTWDSILNLIATPATNCGTAAADGGTEGIMCLAGADNGNPERVSYFNTTANPVDAFLMVKGYFNTGIGRFSLTTTVAPPPVGDLCSNPIMLVSGVTLMNESMTGAFNDYGSGTGCGNLSSGPDKLYAIDVPAGQRARVTVTPSTGLDTSLSLMEGSANCQSMTCFTNGGSGTSGVAEIAYYANTTAMTQTILARVDISSSASTTATWSITAVVDMAPAMGDTCAAPVPLTAGTTLMGESTANFSPDYLGAGTGCSGSSAGPDKVYSISVGSGQRLSTTVTPITGFDTSISIVTTGAGACTTRLCAANGNNGAAGAADTAVWFNGGSQPVTALIIVDSTTGFGNTFDIIATLTTLGPGETCLSPIVLDGTTGTAVPGGFTYAETLLNASNEYAGTVPGCASGSFTGNDKVYAIDTPPGQRTFLLAQPDAGASVSISLLADANACDAVPRQCITGIDATPDLVAAYNFTAGVVRTLAIVDSSSASPGNVQLTATNDTPPLGEVCGNAGAAISMAGTIAGTTVGYFNDYISSSNNQVGCVGGSGPDRVHAVDVPALTRLSVTVQPDAGFNPGLDLFATVADCRGQRVCAASVNASTSTGVAETVVYKNGGAATTVYVSVDSTSSTGTGTGNYDLTVAYTPVVTGDMCQNAVPITMSGMITGETTAGYDHDVGTPGSPASCGGYAYTGADKIYTITIPAGMTLTATVTPSVMTFDPAIYLTTTCSASIAACLAGADVGGAGAADSINFTNTSASAVAAFLVIDRWTNSSPGDAYTLNINIQ